MGLFVVGVWGSWAAGYPADTSLQQECAALISSVPATSNWSPFLLSDQACTQKANYICNIRKFPLQLLSQSQKKFTKDIFNDSSTMCIYYPLVTYKAVLKDLPNQ